MTEIKFSDQHLIYTHVTASNTRRPGQAGTAWIHLDFAVARDDGAGGGFVQSSAPCSSQNTNECSTIETT